VRVSSVTRNSAMITWTSSAPASSLVSYGISVPSATVTGDDGVTSHVVVIDGLAARTRYAYKVESAAANGAQDESAVAFFTTKR